MPTPRAPPCLRAHVLARARRAFERDESFGGSTSLPTLDARGTPLSKSARKKLAKQMEKHESCTRQCRRCHRLEEGVRGSGRLGRARTSVCPLQAACAGSGGGCRVGVYTVVGSTAADVSREAAKGLCRGAHQPVVSARRTAMVPTKVKV